MNEILAVGETASANDRLMVTVFFALVIHALIILEMRFESEKNERIQKSLEIVLVDNPTRAAPGEADYLAQANQIGSGTGQEIAHPQKEMIPVAGGPQPEPRPRMEASMAKKKSPPVMTREKAEHKMESTEPDDGETTQHRPQLTAAGIHEQIAALSAEIATARERISKRPRIKVINSVNAHRYKAAEYEKSWQYKVERIGNLNYPDRARREHLNGSLLLAVGIRNNGAIYQIEVRRSSGHQALDDGAIRIVRLAAPFAPFPDELAMDADVLVITRTWKFSDDTHVTTSR